MTVLDVDGNPIECPDTASNEPKCECGAHSVGVDKHADWCALYVPENTFDGQHVWSRVFNQQRKSYTCELCGLEVFLMPNGKWANTVPDCPGHAP